MLKILYKLNPNISVVLPRIAELCQLSEEEVERVIENLLKEQSVLGKYLELEQFFIRSNGTEEAITALLKSFEESEKRGRGKKS